jgi:hypothetical protein
MLPSLCAALGQGSQLGGLLSAMQSPTFLMLVPTIINATSLDNHFPLDLFVNCFSSFAHYPIVSTSLLLVLYFERVLSP